MADFFGTFLMTCEEIEMADDFGKPIWVDAIYEIEYEATQGHPGESDDRDDQDYKFGAIIHLFITDEGGQEIVVAQTSGFIDRLQDAIDKKYASQIVEKIWDDAYNSW